MQAKHGRTIARTAAYGLLAFAVTPAVTHAQASPFAVGAGAFQANLLAILTPIAVIAVMLLGVGAWFNRIRWTWAVSGVLGIALVFGAPQMVAWVRNLFGV
jgi:type IV secretion system protein VirB2